MEIESAFDESNHISEQLRLLIDLPLFDNSPRILAAGAACALALEHWEALRLSLHAGALSSAVVLHRAQFEALLRSVWLTYAASDLQVEKLSSGLSLEAEQAAKNVPSVQAMLEEVGKKGPKPAFEALERVKTHSWQAMNSYAHAGVHPIHRRFAGYPDSLVKSVLCNANGVAILTGMHSVVLSGRQPLQREVLAIADRHPRCMPPKLET